MLKSSKINLFFIFLALSLSLSLPQASATVNTLGNTYAVGWGMNGGSSAGVFWGLGAINTTFQDGFWGVNYASVFISGGAPFRWLIFDLNGTLLFLSTTQNLEADHLSTASWHNTYFPSGLTLKDNQSIVIGISCEWTNTIYFGALVGSNPYFSYYNTTGGNFFTTDLDSLGGFSSNPNRFLGYISLSSTSYSGDMGGSGTNYGRTSATPTPGPTVPPDGGFGNAMTTIIGLFFGSTPGSVGIGIPLIIIAACALISFKMAGPWGFFAGFNIGVILCFVFNILALWAVIVVIIVDALLLYGKVPTGQGTTPT